MTKFTANVGDKVELIFENGDRITGVVSAAPMSDMIRVLTRFGGDTYISLHSLKEGKVLTRREPKEPFEPEGEGEIFGYLKIDNKFNGLTRKVFISRDEEGLWHVENKTGTWESVQDRYQDHSFLFVRLVEA